MSAALAERDDWTGPLDPYADLPYGSDVYPDDGPTDGWGPDDDPWPTDVTAADPGDPWPFQDAPASLLAVRVPVGSVRRRTRSQRLAVEYRAYLEARHGAAEAATRGNMVSRGGLARGINGRRAWFSGRHASMRYATQELREWFEVNGPCLTATEWRRQQAEESTDHARPADHGTEMEEASCPEQVPAPIRPAPNASHDAGTPTGGRRPVRSGGIAVTGARWRCRYWRYRVAPGRRTLRRVLRCGWTPRRHGLCRTGPVTGHGPVRWQRCYGPVRHGSTAVRCRGASTRRLVGTGGLRKSPCIWMRTSRPWWTGWLVRPPRAVFGVPGRPRCVRCWLRGWRPVGDRGRTPGPGALAGSDIAGGFAPVGRMVRSGTYRLVSVPTGQPILCPVCPGLRMISLRVRRVCPNNANRTFNL